MSAARSRVTQPAPALEHAASGQSGTSVIRGRRSSLDAEDVEQLRVPLLRREVEQAARGRHPEARLGFPAQVVGEGDEARRPAEDLGLRLGEPGELGRPEGRVEEGAGPRVDGLGSSLRASRLAASVLRVSRQPRIGVSAFQFLVDGDEAVREARGRVRLLVPEHAPDGCRDLGWIVGLVLLLPQLAVRLAALVELLSPHRGGADVECEHAHSAGARALRRARSARGRRSVRSARVAPCRAGARS